MNPLRWLDMTYHPPLGMGVSLGQLKVIVAAVLFTVGGDRVFRHRHPKPLAVTQDSALSHQTQKQSTHPGVRKRSPTKLCGLSVDMPITDVSLRSGRAHR